MKARDNPFRVARVLTAIRYEIPAGDGDDVRRGRDGAASLLPRLEALRYRAAIVGPHGSGKTTLLEDLEGVLAARGFRIVHVRLDTDNPRLPREWWSSASCASCASCASRLDESVIVCLDGAEQLGPIAWLRFRWRARRAGGLIVTTHGPGRLATLIECTTSVALLHRIIRRLAPDLVDASPSAPFAPFAPSAPSAAELFTRHRGNIREALRELYDVYAAAGGDRGSHPPRGARSRALV